MTILLIYNGARGVYERWTHVQLALQRRHAKSLDSPKTNITQKKEETNNYEKMGNTSAKGGHNGEL